MCTRFTLAAVAWFLGTAVAAAQSIGSYPAPQGVDFGVRVTDVSGDAARFQRFRDIGDGVFLERVRFDQAGNRWRFELSADHVGRRDQRYVAEYRNGGRITMSFQWDQVPLFISGDTRTLYTRESAGVLRIADSIQQGIENGAVRLADVVGQASPFDVRSRRDIAAFDFIFRASRDLDVKFNLKSTRREGTMPFGAAFGFSNAVEVAAPIDTRTTDVNGTVEWANQRGSLRVGYDGSWFDNHTSTLIWDNPLRFTDITFAGAYSAGTAGSQGRLALWPSSTMHGIGVSGSLKLPAESRATASVNVGNWNQNEPLVPFTINTAIPAVPLARQTAEAEARTLAMNYTLTSRPSPYVWLNARFRYHDFDNRTPHFAVQQYVRLDQVAEVLPSGGNEALSATRHNIDLDASFTPIPFTALRVGYGRDWTDRTHRIFERTAENVFRTSIDATNVGWLTLRAIFERSIRDGSGFDEETLEHIGEHVEMRQFDIANRDRNRVTALVQVTPIPAVGLTASLARGKDDYADSGFGLRDNENRSYSVTLDLVPVERVAAGLTYSAEKYSAFQQSRNASPGAQFLDPTRDWSIDSADKMHNVGATLDLLKVLPRTELRFAYGWNRSRAAYVYGVPSNSTLVAPVQLPPILNEFRSGTADLRYFLTERLAIGGVFWYDHYDVEDYALGPETINRLDTTGSLFLGYLYRPYVARSGWLRLTYLW